jgi:hypothetical protein
MARTDDNLMVRSSNFPKRVRLHNRTYLINAAMSAALNSRPDTSAHSANTTHPDFSLNSSTSLRNIRLPSTSSSQTTASSSAPLSTPPPPPPPLLATTPSYTKRKGDAALGPGRRLSAASREQGDVAEGGVLDTPGPERKRWADGPDTPGATRHKRTASSTGAAKGAHLTLRDQEKVSTTCPNLFLFHTLSSTAHR